MEIISYIFLIIGALFLLLGGLGVFRMPDTFNRIQAGTKATTLGTFSIMIGIAFGVAEAHINWIPKLIIIIVFIAISNPIGSSAIAKATYQSNNIPNNLQQDDFKDRGDQS